MFYKIIAIDNISRGLLSSIRTDEKNYTPYTWGQVKNMLSNNRKITNKINPRFKKN